MAVVSELQGDMRIKKVYQPSPAQLRVLLRYRDGSSKNLIVEVGRKIYLSDYALPSPRQPSNFAMTLRKYLANAIIMEIRQVGFDRIVEISAQTRDGEFKLIFELFGEGNSILTDSEGLIKAVMKPRRFKHRDLVGKQEYAYPPQRLNPFEIGAEELKKVVDGYGSLVKTLAGPLGLGGQYSEEVCARAGIKKDAPSLSLEEADNVVQVLKSLKDEAMDPDPVIILDGETPLDVTPIRLNAYERRETKEFPSFNSALDAFYTEQVSEEVREKAESGFKDALTTINMRLREQARAIKRFNRDIRDGKLIGDTIYANFEAVKTLIDSVTSARKTLPSKEIKSKIADVDVVKQYLPKENALVVSMDGVSFKLDLSIPAAKNADNYYKKSKKAKEKLKGARGAIQKTKAKIKETVEKGRAEAEVEEGMPVKREQRKLKWYERFKWFFSSDGFLVIAGRDATSNEAVVKRHMEKGDVFVHADIHGAPAVVVKTEMKAISDATLEEASQFAASNSTAWKSNAAFLDVYWVNPEQVSKTPKSGEYVGKGAFIIRGKRNYIRSKVTLSIGVKIGRDLMVMTGPESAVDKFCDYHVKIEPGRLKSKEAAQKIKQALIDQAAAEHNNDIKRLNIDDIQRTLPTGGYTIVEGKR
jgi:predicted ribosome quality control (RQC) complex YloA/Tae2 family protein